MTERVDVIRLADNYRRGSTGSLSRASTPNTHSRTLYRGSLFTKRSNASMPSANSRTASDRLYQGSSREAVPSARQPCTPGRR